MKSVYLCAFAIVKTGTQTISSRRAVISSKLIVACVFECLVLKKLFEKTISDYQYEAEQKKKQTRKVSQINVKTTQLFYFVSVVNIIFKGLINCKIHFTRTI